MIVETESPIILTVEQYKEHLHARGMPNGEKAEKMSASQLEKHQQICPACRSYSKPDTKQMPEPPNP